MVALYLLDPQKKTPLQRWQFDSKSQIRIGRSPDNDIVLSEPMVSRYHLELQCVHAEPQRWYLTNRGTNGTFVDGILMTRGLVRDRAIIQLARGGPILQFHQAELSLPVNLQCDHSGNLPNSLFCTRCGQPLTVLRQIRQYQVLRILGQGGMGTTYLAWDTARTNAQHPQLLVLKEMNADMAKIAKAQELFEREARTLATLQHPGIPKYYDFFLQDGKKYLAMELIHGQDLERRILERGPVTSAQAIAWMVQTCDVLDYLHKQEPPLIHRDIKPANLLVRRANNSIVVLDFGAVKESNTTPGTRIGAEGFAAPEQERGQPLTQSDLYAVGATLIFLLTGETPFKFLKQRGRGYRFDLSGVPTITPQLRKVIERATEPIPSDRYATAFELTAALKSAT
ncbi:FHA domain-containing serine/threonine-protein kinase [Chroococcidiopsis sp. TS-821]|uniref:FHA domain-containing serine/threonine-protein kinase n=1 Tax=Chroococcidiopsis sp. TS-821 TaxID=1378066 RepID=UPI000CEE17A8|nr:FHA domain-containing serine/threonine-protein kinase [Chroococcidiopsis sp. TS-821]PPS45556.1 serine/threonine protein kinase [Chroococcidiopsis sp. TS-821]